MLAYHPVTGKEIRILQTDPSIWKEKKTLSYGPSTGIWDNVSSKTDELATFSIALGHLEPEELVARCKQSRLVFLQKEHNPEINADVLRTLGIQNMICLEEMKDLYPHLGDAWDGTLDDAIILIAGLLRYRHIANLPGKLLLPRCISLGIRLESSPKPSPLYWITQYFVADKAKRKREIDICLERNVASERIEHILLLSERKETLPPLATLAEEKGRVVQRIIGHRISYADVLDAAQTLPDDSILAFANADICIDDASWRDLWTVDLTNRCLALLRWDVPASGNFSEATLFGPRADSQDTWVARVKDLKAAAARGAFKTVVGIPFGKMGCDNAFAMEMLRAKFNVINPARTLKTFHVHSSEIRNYSKSDVIERPAFLYIHPTGFHDLEPLINRWPENTVVWKGISAPLTRRLEGSGAQAWMETVNRTLAIGDTPWTLHGVHTLKGESETVLQLKNVWETEDGLCYDQERMYIGPTGTAQKVWGESSLRSLSPSLVSQDAVIVPFTPTIMKQRETFLLHYMSKVIRLRDLGNRYNAEFFCPESKECIDTLQMFDWGAPRMPVIKYEENQQIWCCNALVAPVSDNKHILPEDIASLRKAVRGWQEEVTEGRHVLVLVEDGEILTSERIQILEEALEDKFTIRVVYTGRTSPERWWNVMRGAWGIVTTDKIQSWGWNWLLPKGAYVFEVGSSKSDALTMSAAAELQHRFVKSWSDVQKEVFMNSEETNAEQLSTLWLPRSDLQGFFAHAGDSFREMAKIWAERGYIQVKEHPTATMCWYRAVGKHGVLLYDRPTHEWRLAAPRDEVDCAASLYGNPKPPEWVANSSPWFFWPRRPVLVEEMVADGTVNTPWEERKAGPVFYGKIENKVQEKRRVGVKQPDWSKACTNDVCGEWVMVKGDEKYPLTQKEYLERLARSRFGLCLPGYGWKCHREVECMAMGCVPLVAPDVDMDNYANPPVQGVHYFRVETPEEAIGFARDVSRARWEEMSAACKSWWKANASAEGSFQLTKTLCEKLTAK